MKTSIAMCTYNGARFLPRQLESFARQSCLPSELVVCDDGSTDDSVAIVNRFSEQVSFPVRVVINKQNLGSTKNFEQAIALCQGDLIALSDQDDEWLPGKIAAFQQFFEQCPQALVAFSNAELMDEHSKPTGKKLWRSVYYAPDKACSHLAEGMISTLLQLHNVATGATMIIRKELRDEVIPIPNSWVHDGWILWMAALRGGVGVLNDVTVRYRIHGRQQVGVDSPSLLARVANARRNGKKGQRSIISQLQDLKRYLEQKEIYGRENVIADIDAKLLFLENRLTHKPWLPARIWRVVASWSDYHRYARGTASMVKDAFFPSQQIAQKENGGLSKPAER